MSDDEAPDYAFQTRPRHASTPSRSTPYSSSKASRKSKQPPLLAMQPSLSLSSNSSSDSEDTFIRKYKEKRQAERLALLEQDGADREVSLCRAKVTPRARTRSNATPRQSRAAKTPWSKPSTPRNTNPSTPRKAKRPRARTLNSSTPKSIKKSKPVSPRQSFTSAVHIEVDIDADGEDKENVPKTARCSSARRAKVRALKVQKPTQQNVPKSKSRRSSRSKVKTPKAQTPTVSTFDAKNKSKRSKKLKKVKEDRDVKPRRNSRKRKGMSKTPRVMVATNQKQKGKSRRQKAATPTLHLRQKAFDFEEEEAEEAEEPKKRRKSRSRSSSKSKSKKGKKKKKKPKARKSRARSQTVAGWKPPSWLNAFDEDDETDFLTAKPFNTKESLRKHKHFKASVSVTAWNAKNHY